VKNKFQFLSLSQGGGKAQFTMMLPFGGTSLSLDAMRDSVLAQIRLAAAKPGEQTESLGLGVASQYGAQPAPISFDTVDQLLPKETDYYFKDYRAISASIAPCYALDFSTPGVLEAAVDLLKGQTVYKDHYFYSVDGWVGAVSEAAWDAEGKDSGGIAGINARLKLDAKKDPMLVRGVAMQPPAVHSCSVTVMFEFEYSHPKLVEEGSFWRLLGEEVESEIVRLVVTLIIGFWEISLVFQGAQEENKQLPALPSIPGDVEIDDAEAELGRKDKKNMTAGDARPTTQKEGRQTVKVTDARKLTLGITHEGEDVPDEIVLSRAETLAAEASVGAALTSSMRTECLRLAKLAELGNEEGTLPDALTGTINDASGARLDGLTQMYRERAEQRFPQTCQSCGSQNVAGRSSVEDRTGQPNAGATTPAKPLPVSIH
jgi:hypothetical protein